MSHDATLENIKAELDHVDATALHTIWEIINRSKRKQTTSPEIAGGSALQHGDTEAIENQSLKFVGKNLTLEEYERLSPKERGMLQQRLKDQNHLWLQEKFSALRAAWLVVVDGEVIASGKSLKQLPLAPKNVELSRQTGKFPFVFINDDFMAIEENVSAWHVTNEPEDYYPTLPVTLSSDSKTVEIVGDFDTGASHTFVDYDFLVVKNLLQPEVGDYYEISRHLSQSYHYVAKSFRFQLSSKAGKIHAFDAMIYCVPDWRASPFVKINPDRIALIGRDLLLALKPKVLLDFEKRRTEIAASAIDSRVRKKGNRRKNVNISEFVKFPASPFVGQPFRIDAQALNSCFKNPPTCKMTTKSWSKKFDQAKTEKAKAIIAVHPA